MTTSVKKSRAISNLISLLRLFDDPRVDEVLVDRDILMTAMHS